MNHWRKKERVNLKLPLKLFACLCTLKVCFFCCLLILFQNELFLKIISETLSVSNGWDPDQNQHFVGPDLGSN